MNTGNEIPGSFENITTTTSSLPSDSWDSDPLLIRNRNENSLERGERLIRLVLLIGFIAVMVLEAYLIWKI
ncbi:MAG: hypothetical protein GTO18_13495 [Anaerolineales bacterium]|nr:hypothetical protein [Anaerolineales bacterium]